MSRNHDLSVSDRSLAILALAQFNTPVARDEIITAIRDSSADIRGSAIVAMKAMDDESFVPDISERLLNDSSEMVQLRAVSALSSIGGQKARAELARAAKDTNTPENARIASLHGIQSTWKTAVHDLALSLLSDQNRNVSVTAAVIASHSDPNTLVPYLLDASQDQSLPVWLWWEAVSQLDVGTGEKFLYMTPKEFMKQPSVYRAEIQQAIQEWANNTGE